MISSYLIFKSFKFQLFQRTLDWFDSAEKSRPYEVPPFRIDRVEDIVDPLWVHGVGPGAMDLGSNLEFSRLIYFSTLSVFCFVLFCFVIVFTLFLVDFFMFICKQFLVKIIIEINYLIQ